MSSTPTPEPDSQDTWDPTYLHARREAWIILAVWGACLLWSVPYCYFTGYLQPGETVDSTTIKTIFGIPTWAFWGIAVPWLLADVFTTWFCFFYMADDDLGEAHEGLDLEEEIAEMHAGDKKHA